MRNKRIILVVLIIALIFNTGCWDKRELNSLAIVSGIGIDSYKNGKIKLTIQVIKLNLSQTSNMGAGVSTSYFNFACTGDNVSDAIREIRKSASRKIYFPHNYLIIFSEKLAKKGIGKYMDMFARNSEIRPITYIAISRGSATKVMQIKPNFKFNPAYYIREILKNQREAFIAKEVYLKDFLVRYMNKTTAPTIPVVEIVKKGGKEKLRLGGVAAFKNDKLARIFSINSFRGVLWVKGEFEEGEMELPNNKDLIEIKYVKTKIIPYIKNNQVYMKINLNTEGKLIEKNETGCVDAGYIMKLQKDMKKVIYNEIMQSVNEAKKFNTDVLGFSEAIYRKYPKEWLSMQGRWKEIFPNIKIITNIEAKITTTGQINNVFK